jgi:hypothetical protein
MHEQMSDELMPDHVYFQHSGVGERGGKGRELHLQNTSNEINIYSLTTASCLAIPFKAISTYTLSFQISDEAPSLWVALA